MILKNWMSININLNSRTCILAIGTLLIIFIHHVCACWYCYLLKMSKLLVLSVHSRVLIATWQGAELNKIPSSF